MAGLATAPQSIGGVLDSGFKLFTASFKQVFWLAFVAALVSAPFSLIGQRLMTQPPAPGTLGQVGLAALLLLVVVLIIWATILVRLDGVANERVVPAREAFAIGLRRAPALFAAGFLYSIVSGIGMLLLLIPGVIVTVYWLFGPIATVTEPLGPIAGLGYSFNLVRGHWWRTAGLLTIIGIIALVIYLVLGLVAGLAVAMNIEQIVQGQMPWYIDFVVNPLISAVGSPLLYCLVLATFYDLKLRREGGDLAERIAAAT